MHMYNCKMTENYCFCIKKNFKFCYCKTNLWCLINVLSLLKKLLSIHQITVIEILYLYSHLICLIRFNMV